jgi:hypothetical protein
MKTLLFTLLAIISLTFFSCTKTNPTPPTNTTSHWTYNGVTWVSPGDSTFGDITGQEGTLLSNAPDNALGHYITVAFYPAPTKDGSYTYTLINQYNQAYEITNGQGWILFGNQTGNGVNTYSQYGSSGGGTINLTVLNGRITVTFSNILSQSALTPSVTTTISGTLIQNAGVFY